jgi:hypothetical protein
MFIIVDILWSHLIVHLYLAQTMKLYLPIYYVCSILFIKYVLRNNICIFFFCLNTKMCYNHFFFFTMKITLVFNIKLLGCIFFCIKSEMNLISNYYKEEKKAQIINIYYFLPLRLKRYTYS